MFEAKIEISINSQFLTAYVCLCRTASYLREDKDTKMKCGVKNLLRNFFAYRSCMNSGSTSTAAANNIGSSTNRRFTVVPRTVTRLPS